MPLVLESLEKAVASYEKAVAFALNTDKMDLFEDDEKNTIRAGVIQNFKFTFELCWKFMKRWLVTNYFEDSTLDGISKKELFRISSEHKLIEDTEKWFAIILVR